MNYWLTTTEYPPDYGGGISTYTYHTARMLSERGHDVAVFVALEDQSAGLTIEEPSVRLRVVRFSPNQTPQSSALGPWARFSFDTAHVLEQFIKEEGPPDVIESQEYLGLPYFLIQRKLCLERVFKDIPILVTAHTPLFLCYRYDQAPQYRFPGYWTGEMERFSVLAADGLVCPSRFLQQQIENELPQVHEHCRVIANPYSVDFQIPAFPTENLRKGFLFPARIQRLKGIEPLLKSFRQLWDEGLEEPLILIGGDWYDELHQRWMGEVIQERYKTYIERGLLDWRGRQSPEHLRDVYSQVKAVILPSFIESYSYVVVEAMSVGALVMVSTSGGHAEIVEDGVSGWVFSHHKPGDLEQKIISAVELSPDEWKKISASAQARVRSLSSYESVAPQKEEMLEWVRTRHHPRRSFPFLRGDQRTYSPPIETDLSGESGLLSIVIPFYNLGEYLEDALRPLLQLDDLPLEILVLDDGSDDPHSQEILEELHRRYSFRLVRTANQGLSLTRNTGARLARGEFLAFLDADDWMDVRFYRLAVSVLRQYENVSFVGCWAEYFGEAQGWWPTWNPEPPYALVHNPINTSALVYRKADFLRYGLNDPSVSRTWEDYDGLLGMLENGCRGVAIPEPYFKYRVRSSSRAHTACLQEIIYVYQQITRKHIELYRKYADEIVNLLNANGPVYLYDNPTLWYPKVGFINSPNPTVESPPIALQQDKPILPYIPKPIRFLLRKPYRVFSAKFPGLVKLLQRLS